MTVGPDVRSSTNFAAWLNKVGCLVVWLIQIKLIINIFGVAAAVAVLCGVQTAEEGELVIAA